MGRRRRPVSVRHVLEQGPMLKTMGSVALAMLHPSPAPKAAAPALTPGPWLEETLKPRSEALIRDYVRHVGGDPAWYRGQVPAHLAPQWTLHLAARTLAPLPYPVTKALNAGCRLELKAPLPAGEPLLVRGRLESIDEDERRALLTQRFVTGTKSTPEAVVLELRVFIPLAKSGPKDGKPAKKSAPVVPVGARELAFFDVAAHAGLDFAKLTGDFNPVHWVPAYARAAGFRSAILHGFATVARAIEALNRSVFSGDPSALSGVDAKFTRPLVLPGQAGVYVTAERGLYVGDAPGGLAYLEGHFEPRRRGGSGGVES